MVATVAERQSLLIAAGRWLDVSSPLNEPVDYVLVLGGGAISRPFVAAAILRAGLAKKVLIQQFEESHDVRDGIALLESDMIRQVLLRSGVSAEAIVDLDAVVDSTESEAHCLARFLEEHPGAQVAVVTSDFHTRRTRLLFSRSCRSHAQNVHFVGAPTDGFDASNWWHFEDGFKLYLFEYLKLVRAEFL